jgi:hypothetical protein
MIPRSTPSCRPTLRERWMSTSGTDSVVSARYEDALAKQSVEVGRPESRLRRAQAADHADSIQRAENGKLMTQLAEENKRLYKASQPNGIKQALDKGLHVALLVAGVVIGHNIK